MKSNTVLTGNLNFLNLGDIFQILGSNGASGILRITNKYIPKPGLVYFNKGDIINGSNNALTGLEAVYSLFGWIEGEFEFDREEIKIKRIININRMEIILDGLRMLDDGKIEKIGPISFEEKASGSAHDGSSIPVIKGPFVDYEFVAGIEEFDAGKKIVQENKYGSWIWVLLKGVADIVKDTAEGPLTLLKISDGTFIGSVTSFSYSSNIRSATVIAADDVQLGVLDSQRLSQKFNKMSPELKKLILGLDNRLRQVTNRAVEVYSNDSKLKEHTQNKKLIIKQGDEKEKVFFITKGEASIVRKTDDGHILLANLKKDDFIGQLPFFALGHEPHAASVFASKDFKASGLNINNLIDEYDQLPNTLKNMVEHLATSISVISRMAYDFHKEIHLKDQKRLDTFTR